MKTFSKTLCVSWLVLATTAIGASAATVDTIDATSGQAGTFFVPTLGQELASPYYRFNGAGWGWKHNAITSGFTTAFLNISAYDVDEGPLCGGFPTCENDTIEAYDADSDLWILLGSLTGDDNAFSFTSFDLAGAASGTLLDDVADGLMVRMNIDVDNAGWAVSLSKSVITTDGADPGNPNPSVVPLPAGAWLMMTGVVGLAALRRRRKA